MSDYCVVSISEILKDPKKSLSAKDWCERKKTPEESNRFDFMVKEEIRKLKEKDNE